MIGCDDQVPRLRAGDARKVKRQGVGRDEKVERHFNCSKGIG